MLRGSLEQLFELQRFTVGQRGELVEAGISEFDDRRVAQIVSERRGRREELTFRDWGDGWVLLTMAETAVADYALYSAWFGLVYLSIDRASDEGAGP